MIKLDVGAGIYPRGEDFTCVDEFVTETPPGFEYVKASMKALPYGDNTVDEIWCSHALEHVAMAEVPVVLREFLRVLKVGGRAIVSVPNFDYVAKYWLTGPDRVWAEQMIFGQQNHAGEFHRSAFTAGLLKGDLEGVGFTVERVEYRWTHNQETLQAVATKPAPATIQ